jgi:hypothetical protein
MRCRAARRAIVENELQGLGVERSAALDRHLRRCAACTRRSRLEQRLERDLVALHGVELEQIGPVDVVPRVMATIDRSPGLDRRDVPARQLGWASAAAALLALFLLPVFVATLPDPSRLARAGVSLRLVLDHLIERGAALLGVLWTLMRVLLHSLVDALGALGSALALLEPVAVTASAVGYAAMALTVVVVLGRDLRRGALVDSVARKER